MQLKLLCKANWESRVDMMLRELSKTGYRERFESRDYGPGLDCVCVMFICLEPSLKVEQGIELTKQKNSLKDETVLYIDVILDLPKFKALDRGDPSRKRIMAQCLYDEVLATLSRYEIPEFDRDAFVAEFSAWINETGWRALI